LTKLVVFSLVLPILPHLRFVETMFGVSQYYLASLTWFITHNSLIPAVY